MYTDIQIYNACMDIYIYIYIYIIYNIYLLIYRKKGLQVCKTLIRVRTNFLRKFYNCQISITSLFLGIKAITELLNCFLNQESIKVILQIQIIY